MTQLVPKIFDEVFNSTEEAKKYKDALEELLASNGYKILKKIFEGQVYLAYTDMINTSDNTQANHLVNKGRIDVLQTVVDILYDQVEVARDEIRSDREMEEML